MTSRTSHKTTSMLGERERNTNHEYKNLPSPATEETSFPVAQNKHAVEVRIGICQGPSLMRTATEETSFLSCTPNKHAVEERTITHQRSDLHETTEETSFPSRTANKNANKQRTSHAQYSDLHTTATEETSHTSHTYGYLYRFKYS